MSVARLVQPPKEKQLRVRRDLCDVDEKHAVRGKRQVGFTTDRAHGPERSVGTEIDRVAASRLGLGGISSGQSRFEIPNDEARAEHTQNEGDQHRGDKLRSAR